MSALVRQRARIARVRGLQHVIAAGIAADAAARVAQLEGSAERLGQLRGLLLDTPDAGDGRSLSNAHELAGRLDQARAGLTAAIASARSAAALREAERIAARVDQEGAERLRARAEHQAGEAAERRLSAIARPRRKDPLA